jgi:hypothetical protein
MKNSIMYKIYCFLTLILLNILSVSIQAQETSNMNFPKLIEHPKRLPAKENVWVFIMAGQSNMAGRGQVEPNDTISNQRILSINSIGELILAKEPLSLYEPKLKRLDCGVSFGRELLKHIPDSISILIVPTAVGGSAIDQWLGDSLHRGVKLMSNFKEKILIANKYGQIKGLLWHQGESDAKELLVNTYSTKLKKLFKSFRKITNEKRLPILSAQIGTFGSEKIFQNSINQNIVKNAKKDKHTYIIRNDDFTDIGDKLHFDSKSQRIMGERFAQKYIEIKKPCYILK